MNKKFLGIGSAIGVAAIIISVFLIPTDFDTPSQKINDTGYDYTILNNEFRDRLNPDEVYVSTPIILKSDDTIEKYCSFFSDDKLQKQVKHCTSTELRNSEGVFLGNIHVVGSVQSPGMVITLIQSDPFVSQIPEIKSVFNSIIVNNVYDYWEEGPEDFPTIDSWIDGVFEFHTSGEKPKSNSQIITNDGKKLQIELTTNTEGYLWKLIVDL